MFMMILVFVLGAMFGGFLSFLMLALVQVAADD